MRIHVTEEARHLSFARQYLRTNVPTLSRRRRHAISIQAPFILAEMASVMMRPPRTSSASTTYQGRDRGGVRAGRASRDATRASLRKVRNLLAELGLITPVANALEGVRHLGRAAAASAER